MTNGPQSQLPNTGPPGTGVIATVLILLVGLIALQVMSLQQSAEALKSTHAAQQKLTTLIQARTERALTVAQQALVAAGAARPDPYTGTHARADELLRVGIRKQDIENITTHMDHRIEIMEAKTALKLGALEIPPKSVRELLAALTRQGITHEKDILVLSLALERIKPGSTKAPDISKQRDE